MKSFYEKYRDDNGELLIMREREPIFPTHFHINMEIFLVRQGNHNMTINETHYTLTDGCIAVVDSYDIHGYTEPKIVGDACAVMIPYAYLQRFNAKRKTKKIARPVFEDKALCDKLLHIIDEYLSPAQNAEAEKAAVELFLALLSEKLEFTENKTGDERELVRKILAYVQENYRGEVTRAALAHALGYTEAHVSRVFHRYLKTGITEYVNGLRLAYIERLRRSGDERTTTELIYEAGFKSLQTYYRVKKKLS